MAAGKNRFSACHSSSRIPTSDWLRQISNSSCAKANAEGSAGGWQLPQGGVDEGEDLRVAVLRELAEAFYSPPAARNHYLSMAKKNFRGYLQGDSVRFKKYFYVLRPLLAVRWIDQGRGRPPMTFADLLTTVDDRALLAEVDELLALKRNADESAYGPRRPALHGFIAAELEREVPTLLRTPEDSRRLDRYLRDTVGRYA